MQGSACSGFSASFFRSLTTFFYHCLKKWGFQFVFQKWDFHFKNHKKCFLSQIKISQNIKIYCRAVANKDGIVSGDIRRNNYVQIQCRNNNRVIRNSRYDNVSLLQVSFRFLQNPSDSSFNRLRPHSSNWDCMKVS